MSQENKYCPAGHSSADFCSGTRNYIDFSGLCFLCSREHSIQEFKTWSSGNTIIDKIIQESQINVFYKLLWIPYDNFQNIEHIADGGHGSVYSAKIENGIKRKWNFINQDWVYDFKGNKVALKEIKDSRYDIAEFCKAVTTVKNFNYSINYYGISKNPSTQNYIIVMELFDEDLHNFLIKNFWDLRWNKKIDMLFSIACSIANLRLANLVHCDLHSGNVLMMDYFDPRDFCLPYDPSSCKIENDLILNSNNKNNKIYGSIPYIPPEVLRGNEFTRKGDIYSFGGIMYEIATAQRRFPTKHMILI
ncbi:hypothetical protein Glove_557g56 [Diversispora epigaea]|uniref:Protein kinase domain-containing protein n=1 Tax=Diversispora epigaea TaxID=1348612 RepID=A0A397GJC7_9GLOM|nr:hypothetical protein Glove_557g56 [Diversispora epigaea]